MHYILAVSAGFAAGVINTLAGSGSIFTLPALLFLGLPVHEANATNRVGIITQTFVGALTFHRRGSYRAGKDFWYALPLMAGSATGAWIATDIDETALRFTIAVVMLGVLLLLVLQGKKQRAHDNLRTRAGRWFAVPALFFTGVYGGFIQLGVGILLLSTFMWLLRMQVNHANALKNSLNFLMTLPAFLIFWYHGQIRWEIGLVVATGQTAGAYIAARFATGYKKAEWWIRFLLMVMSLVTSLKLFGVF